MYFIFGFWLLLLFFFGSLGKKNPEVFILFSPQAFAIHVNLLDCDRVEARAALTYDPVMGTSQMICMEYEYLDSYITIFRTRQSIQT
mgnify:CR=1 FL=1